jgi:hypothetical protein
MGIQYTERDYNDAVDAMMLANIDYEDNKGNREYAEKFWLTLLKNANTTEGCAMRLDVKFDA